MEKRIVYRRRFRQEIAETSKYILEQWGEIVHQSFLKRIENSIKEVHKYPDKGKPSLQISGVRSVIVKPHQRLYYRSKDEVLEILALIDMRQHPSKNPY